MTLPISADTLKVIQGALDYYYGPGWIEVEVARNAQLANQQMLRFWCVRGPPKTKIWLTVWMVDCCVT